MPGSTVRLGRNAHCGSLLFKSYSSLAVPTLYMIAVLEAFFDLLFRSHVLLYGRWVR